MVKHGENHYRGQGAVNNAGHVHATQHVVDRHRPEVIGKRDGQTGKGQGQKGDKRQQVLDTNMYAIAR